ADTGEQLLDLTTGLSQMGPPMTFLIDGKQYVAIAGGPPATGGGGGRGAGAAPAGGAAQTGPRIPSRLFLLAGDGKKLPQGRRPRSRRACSTGENCTGARRTGCPDIAGSYRGTAWCGLASCAFRTPAGSATPRQS